MPVQIPLKLNFERDAQRQGHVGYSTEKIYPADPSTGNNPYVDGIPNGDRVKGIFDDRYTSLEANEVAVRSLARIQFSQDFNPDFAAGEVDYSYRNRSNSQRASDLLLSNEDKTLKRAPNVNPDSETYVEPFKSLISNGGFGNDAEQGTLHKADPNDATDSADMPDSAEFLLKYIERPAQ